MALICNIYVQTFTLFGAEAKFISLCLQHVCVICLLIELVFVYASLILLIHVSAAHHGVLIKI